jgi:radical SAM superfamily enzyme YgiQ (UPF0313 family)
MNLLLLSMPDSFEHMPVLTIRMPNGALASLAGNIDPHHTVAIADLILVQRKVPETIRRLMAEYDPDIVGLSIMTFQRKTAFAVIDLVRSIKPNVQIVVGGYDPSLATDAYADAEDGRVDFVVRGEGEITFRELLRAIETQAPFDGIDGLSWRDGDSFRHNRPRGLSSLDSGEIRPPKRSARVLAGYSIHGRQVDVIETSRGCTFDCSFCSIIEMRGRNFYKFNIDRVLDDIRDAMAHGARSIFIVDDNITLNVKRFEALCQAIVDAGLNTIDYTIQGMTATMANHGATLAPLMKKAGFRYVFLGIENVVDKDLDFFKASSKNTRRVDGKRAGNASLQAIQHIQKNGMYVVGGLIVGSPIDSREDIETNLEFVRRYVDYPYIQHPTPYPGTPMTADLAARGLIVNRNLEEYDGTTAVVANEHLPLEEIEYMRWRAERPMKIRHGWAVFRHDPRFFLEMTNRVIRFIYRGETWLSLFGLASKRKAFERYREIRRRERQYI